MQLRWERKSTLHHSCSCTSPGAELTFAWHNTILWIPIRCKFVYCHPKHACGWWMMMESLRIERSSQKGGSRRTALFRFAMDTQLTQSDTFYCEARTTSVNGRAGSRRGGCGSSRSWQTSNLRGIWWYINTSANTCDTDNVPLWYTFLYQWKHESPPDSVCCVFIGTTHPSLSLTLSISLSLPPLSPPLSLAYFFSLHIVHIGQAKLPCRSSQKRRRDETSGAYCGRRKYQRAERSWIHPNILRSTAWYMYENMCMIHVCANTYMMHRYIQPIIHICIQTTHQRTHTHTLTHIRRGSSSGNADWSKSWRQHCWVHGSDATG